MTQPVVQLVLDDCKRKQQEPTQITPPQAAGLLADAPQPLAIQSAYQDRSAMRDATGNPDPLTNAEGPTGRQFRTIGVHPDF